MKKHSFKEWFAATRYWSFPVSTMPVVVTFAYLFANRQVPSGALPWIVLALSLVGVVILHSAGNLLSDWFDYRTGVDNKDAYAVPNLVFGKFQPKEYLFFSIIPGGDMCSALLPVFFKVNTRPTCLLHSRR